MRKTYELMYTGDSIDAVEQLRVVDAEEGGLEVEDDAGGDHRAGQTSAPDLVGAGDTAKTIIAEPALDRRHLGEAR
jgi:hypothetical protein